AVHVMSRLSVEKLTVPGSASRLRRKMYWTLSENFVTPAVAAVIVGATSMTSVSRGTTGFELVGGKAETSEMSAAGSSDTPDDPRTVLSAWSAAWVGLSTAIPAASIGSAAAAHNHFLFMLVPLLLRLGDACRSAGSRASAVMLREVEPKALHC